MMTSTINLEEIQISEITTYNDNIYNHIQSYTKLDNLEKKEKSKFLSISIAESMTAGAVSNIICSDPESSPFFYGGIIVYNIESQKKILNVDEQYDKKNNFANPYTTFTMAKNITKKFNSRLGLSNTGFSLPFYKSEELDNNGKIIKCEIDVKLPFAYICLYDKETDYNKIHFFEYDKYDKTKNQKGERAIMQVLIAKKSKEIFYNYCIQIIKNNKSNILDICR